MRRVYYYFEGGLGDVIEQYNRCPYLANLSKTQGHYDMYTKVVLNTHNPQAAELFRYDERFNEIQVFGYKPEERELLWLMMAQQDFKPAEDLIEAYPQINYPFVLSDADLSYVNSLRKDRSFILFQPGSGKDHFTLHSMLDFDRLCDMASYHRLRIIAVGGSHSHTHHVSTWKSDAMLRPHDNLIDLTHIANPRICCALAARCHRFIGSFSCYLWHAAAHDKRCHTFIPPGHDDGHVAKARAKGNIIMQTLTTKVPVPDDFYEELVVR